MSPKFFDTTLTVAPFLAAHWFATCVMAGARFASVQITMVGPALWEATAEVAATAETAATTPSSAHMRLRLSIKNPLPCLGTTRHGPAGGRHRKQCRDVLQRTAMGRRYGFCGRRSYGPSVSGACTHT